MKYFILMAFVYCFLILMYLTSCGDNMSGPVGKQGTSGTTGLAGLPGKPGDVGLTGNPGVNGSSCHVIQGEDMAKIVCDDGSSAEVHNGQNGQDAKPCTVASIDGRTTIECPDGSAVTFPTSHMFKRVINPCGDGPGVDEIIFEFEDGGFVAWYYNVGLVLLDCGQSYVTTDSQRCVFKLSDDCVYLEVKGE